MTSTLFPGSLKESKPTKAEIEAIYWAYPRHVEKVDAIKAIEKALRSIPYDSLLSTTKAFAASPAGQKGNLSLIHI